MANRIRNKLSTLGNSKLLIPFFTAGYPDLKTSMEYVRVAADSGADMIEIGMPFSDPLADGPLIQHSSYIALQDGVNLKRIIDEVIKIRANLLVPIILMGYYNPVRAYGYTRFLKDAKSSGVDGFIIPDLTIEEASNFNKQIKKNDLSAVYLVAPTSTKKRIKMISEMSTDFVYAVTVTGVTGTGKVFGKETDIYLKKLKSILDKPFVAGFGVSSPESAKRLGKHCNGVVIGSALVQIIKNAGSKKSSLLETGRFLKNIRKAL